MYSECDGVLSKSLSNGNEEYTEIVENSEDDDKVDV